MVKERATSINPMVVGSIHRLRKLPSLSDRAAEENPGPLIPPQQNPCGEGTRYFGQKSAPGNRRGGIEKPPAFEEAIAQTIKRKPIVPSGSAGMVRRRVTSSAKRSGTVVPRPCSIFLPARICRKATEVDVVKPKVPEQKAPRERSDGENDEDKRMEALVSD